MRNQFKLIGIDLVQVFKRKTDKTIKNQFKPICINSVQVFKRKTDKTCD